MGDRIYRVSFIASPIRIHAKDAAQAKEKAIEYLRLPGTTRIVIEEATKEQHAGS